CARRSSSRSRCAGSARPRRSHRSSAGWPATTQASRPARSSPATAACTWVDPESPMANATRLIKKYPNRRLYDTQTSAYITLADVKQLVLGNENFKVVDAKSGEDL